MKSLYEKILFWSNYYTAHALTFHLHVRQAVGLYCPYL